MDFITSRSLAGFDHGFGMAGSFISGRWKGLCFRTNQMHGDRIISLSSHLSALRNCILEADAFITNEPGIVCYVRTADCVPILMCDPVKKAVAAVHAGWRGTSLNIAAKVISKMEEEFGSRRKDILAAIGPSISGKCYEVGEDVRKLFVPASKGRGKIDLQDINRQLLLDAGVNEIEIIPICNHCDTRFASYRRDRSEKRRQVNFILLSQ